MSIFSLSKLVRVCTVQYKAVQARSLSVHLEVLYKDLARVPVSPLACLLRIDEGEALALRDALHAGRRT